MGKQIHISAKNIKQKCGQRELRSTDTGSIKNFLIKIEPRGFERSTTLRLFQVKIKRMPTFLDTVNDKVDLFLDLTMSILLTEQQRHGQKYYFGFAKFTTKSYSNIGLKACSEIFSAKKQHSFF